ncbi:MAG TPA: hypothetical protein VFQ30_05835, partial [Ktedonobacteraceae bacterium]|nr:hypothetical protein [Ktedonobacteraceae bacterium]
LCSPASPEATAGEHKASPLQHRQPAVGAQNETGPSTSIQTPPGSQQSGILASVRAWWSGFYASPYRRSLLLLLCWQLLPLLILTRHSIDLHTQYFLLFLPGPYIFVGLIIAKIGELLQHYQRSLPLLQWALYALYLGMALVIVAQFVLSAAGLVDQVEGYYNDRSFQPYPYHNDLRSLQTALSDADTLAQQRHLSKVYVTMDSATQTALGFLTEQMHTPTTLFDAGRCLLLPGPTAGPAVLLVGPYDTLTNTLISQFAHATLIEQSPRPGGAPFKLYIVDPASATASSSAAQPRFGHDIQLLNVQARHLAVNNALWLIARWSLLHSVPSAPRTTYSYSINVSPAGSTTSMHSTCILGSLQAGGQVLSALSLPQGSTTPTSVGVSVQSFTTTPYNPAYGPLHLETYISHYSPSVMLPVANGKTSITVPVSG